VSARRAANPGAKLNDAFRDAGLDEHTLAAHYAHVLDLLALKMAEGESVDKIVIDFLKECRSVLDPPRSAASSSNADGAPVSVTLVHSVDRPVRPAFDSPQDPPFASSRDDDSHGDFPVL